MEGRLETIAEMKLRFLKEALKRTNGNRKKTAKLLGVTERTVYKMITDNNIKGSN
jgi:transcriptional regulator with PAS, ATPase and Fis domain